MILSEMKVAQFIAEVASNSPAPGGGSASVLAGSIGSGLAAMVCNLTLGNKNYPESQKVLQELLPKVASLEKDLLTLVDEDTKAFNKVMAAYKLPKGTEEEQISRKLAIRAANQEATEVPLKGAELCLEILRMLPSIARLGNINAISDVGVAAYLAKTGLEGTILNVKINLPGLKDEVLRTAFQKKIAEMQAEGTELFQLVEQIVAVQLSS